MILNETMNEIADAIREKKGSTEKIAPINFAEEIKSISAGVLRPKRIVYVGKMVSQ